MQKHRRLICLMAAAVLLGPAGVVTLAADEDVVTVVVTGRGISEESARVDAMRVALEQAGKVEIASHSEVQNYELIRDSIFSRAEGIVKDYKVLETGNEVGGIVFCKIRANVSRSAIASSWLEVQNVLEQVGNPGIAVYITETIDGQLQNSSILETRIENKLLEVGFKVYAREHLKLIKDKEAADARAESNLAKAQALAKNFDTEIFITGTASANAAGISNAAGTKLAMYNGDAAIKMYYTDTGQLCASESIPNWRGGARGHFELSPQAGKKALENAGNDIVDWMYWNAMRQWATRISAGGEINLEIEGMKMGDAIRLKKRIRGIDPDRILQVNGPKGAKGVMVYRIKAKMTAETLAEHLVEGEWEKMIEIVDLKLNRIQAKWIGS